MVLSGIVAESAETGTIANIFQSSPDDQRVIIAHGYGIRVGIWNGQLEVSDGIGKHRRTRKLPKADRTIKRLVITATEGYVTLAALRWCRAHDLSVHMIDAAGDLVATHVPESTSSVKLLRRQCFASPDGPLADKGIEVSRYLLTIKLRGQSRNAFQLLDNPQAAMKIDHYADMLTDTTTYDELNGIERDAAGTYFTAWQTANVCIPWPDKERELVPSNWLAFQRRKTLDTTGGNRNAMDPVNSILNYAYTIGYAESRIACIANSLHPQLGYMHADSDKRDSLALDIVETVRPIIDAHILGLLGYGCDPYTFTRKLFREHDGVIPGTIRLVAPLTHDIAGQSMIWQDQLNKVARDVAGILGAAIGKTGQRSLNLKTQKDQFVNRDIDIDSILPVAAWQSIRPILPPEKASPKGGFAPISSRSTLAAMIYLRHHGKPWAHVPSGFGVAHRTLRDRRQEWRRLGIWTQVESWINEMAAKPM